MTSKQSKAIAAAASHLAVANTPLFIARKIRQDADCINYVRSANDKNLELGLLKALSIEPKSLRQAAAPYLYATGIFMKGKSVDFLKKCRANAYYYPFFEEMQNYFVASFKPTKVVSYDLNMENKNHNQNGSLGVSNSCNTFDVGT